MYNRVVYTSSFVCPFSSCSSLFFILFRVWHGIWSVIVRCNENMKYMCVCVCPVCVEANSICGTDIFCTRFCCCCFWYCLFRARVFLVESDFFVVAVTFATHFCLFANAYVCIVVSLMKLATCLFVRRAHSSASR